MMTYQIDQGLKSANFDQNVEDMTRYKLQAICSSTNKVLFFPLYGEIKFKGQ
jgi:hypothetical protein